LYFCATKKERLMNIELLLLIVSILFFVSIIVNKAGYKFGVPALLLFLAVGMLFGYDGIGFQFNDSALAQAIGTVSLCIILFTGGMGTKISDIKPVMAQGLLLSTLGVVITASLTGLAIWWIFSKTSYAAIVSFPLAFLVASAMSSTDSASVFSILGSNGLNLKNNLRPMLELESGSNDPMAYVLTLALIDATANGSELNISSLVFTIILQLVIGCILGALLGKLFLRIINRIGINNSSLYPILVLTLCIFAFAFTHFCHGNSYLAVYISGLVLGNHRFIRKHATMNFFDGLSWLCQMLMFLVLGLMVVPSMLIQPSVLIPGLIISTIMICITRPISVFTCLLPFRKMPTTDKLFVSWVGLRGAVPIIFAILAGTAHVPHSELIFNIVFFCTLVSLLTQGTLLTRAAEKLNVIDTNSAQDEELKHFEIELPEEIKSAAIEIDVNNNLLVFGNKLKDIGLPPKTLVIMVRREKHFFVPTGESELQPNDKLLVITDNQDTLARLKQRISE